MSLIEKLKNNIEGISITKEGHYIVAVKLKPEWNKFDGKKVVFTKNSTMEAFVGEESSVVLDTILEHIQYVIDVNIENEAKTELFNVYYKEMETLFKETSLDKLKTLEFMFKPGSNIEIHKPNFSLPTTMLVEPQTVVTENIEENVTYQEPEPEYIYQEPEDLSVYENMSLSEIEALSAQGGIVTYDENDEIK